MKDTTNIKEQIINTTIELIQEHNGDVSKITIRKISERANVGLGLINYHFGSKENLIIDCVQRIINNVVMCFSTNKKECAVSEELSDLDKLANWAKQVFNFLFENHAISRISILGDMQNYCADSNSVNTQKGFAMALSHISNESTRRLLVFVLTSAIQVAFLSGSSSKEIIGYDLYVKEERDLYIDMIVKMLFLGAEREDN